MQEERVNAKNRDRKILTDEEAAFVTGGNTDFVDCEHRVKLSCQLDSSIRTMEKCKSCPAANPQWSPIT